jgi:amidase
MHGTVMSHRDLLAADAAQLRLQRQWRACCGEWDVVIHPAAAVPAFPRYHSERIEARPLNKGGKSYRYRDACFMWPDPATTTCGLPATAVPIDRSSSVLPIGVQIIGPHLGDRTAIGFAELLERAFGGFVPPPQC